MKALIIALAVVVAGVGTLAPATASTGARAKCDVHIGGTNQLQSRLNAAGAGAVVCLTGTFGTKTAIKPLHGQTIIGGKLVYTGNINICWPCGLTNGYDLKAGNVTLRHVEVAGFEGKGVLCGPGSVVRGSYLHGNKENGIGCFMDSGDWHVVIANNRVIHNGSPPLEYHVSAGIKLLQVSRPKHPLKAGAWIYGNVSARNYGNGIWLDRSSSGSTIAHNVTYGNTHFGIRCEKCAGPVLIQGNNSYNNDYPGYSVRNSAVVTLRNNRSHANHAHHGPGNRSGLVISYAGKNTKTWPNLGNLHMGYHAHSIRVFDIHLYNDRVAGCDYNRVRCFRR